MAYGGWVDGTVVDLQGVRPICCTMLYPVFQETCFGDEAAP